MIELGTTTDFPSHVMAISIVRSSWTAYCYIQLRVLRLDLHILYLITTYVI